MTNENESPKTTEIVPRRLDIIPHAIRQLSERITQHKRYTATVYSEWVNYSNQKHVRQAVVDHYRNLVWMATWGGVLVWNPKEQTCTRHTSEHGLIGNATAAISCDTKGTIWAAGQSSGLSYLISGEQSIWETHHELALWKVIRMAPAFKKGIFLFLQSIDGKTAIGKTDHDEPLKIIRSEGLECLDVMTMLVNTENGDLWIGNAWGLHHYIDGRGLESYDIDGAQVRSLADAVGGGLWVGTNHGLYRFQLGSENKVFQESDWPKGEVLDLRMELKSGNLWIITPETIGRLADNTWQPIRESLPFEPGLSRFSQQQYSPDLTTDLISEGHIWACGADGLFDISMDVTKPAFAFIEEDQLSNAIQALHINDNEIWIGSARGLFIFNHADWRSHTRDIPDLRDLRVIVEGQVNNQIVAGSWVSGLHRFIDGIHVPDQSFTERIVAMSRKPDNTLWAATIDAIYFKKNLVSGWQMVEPPASDHIGSEIIQTILFQSVNDTTGEIVETLWVGTSNGLLRYRPDYKLWDRIIGDVNRLSVESLAIDPLTCHLWVGTRNGLFSDHEWKCFLSDLDIRSLAFGQDGSLWIGAHSGLQHWPSPGEGDCFARKPLDHYSIINSGLPANMVTALATKWCDKKYELWIGTSCGLSCLLGQEGR